MEKRTYRSTPTPEFAKKAFEAVEGGSKKLEVEDITALTEAQLGELEVGSVVECQGKLYSVEEKTEASSPEVVRTIDGVDYYHMLDGVALAESLETGHYYDLDLADLGTSQPNVLPFVKVENSLYASYIQVVSSGYDSSWNRQNVNIHSNNSSFPIPDDGQIQITDLQTAYKNVLSSEYFTAGYFEKTTEEGAELQGGIIYYNLVSDVSSPAKLSLVSVDSEKVTEVLYEDNAYVSTTTTALQELPATLGTAGQVLTVNSGATGVEWANAQGGGNGFYLHQITFGNMQGPAIINAVSNISTPASSLDDVYAICKSHLTGESFGNSYVISQASFVLLIQKGPSISQNELQMYTFDNSTGSYTKSGAAAENVTFVSDEVTAI